MKYKTILITGGAGFVGSNLAVSLKNKYPKLKVMALDNLKRRGSELNILRLKEEGIGFIHADIRCPEDLKIAAKIDLLIECSAEPSVLAGFRQDPGYLVNTNLHGAINCFELARAQKSDIIFLSTSRVYAYQALNSLKIKELDTRFVWEPGQKTRGWSEQGISTEFTIDGPKTLYGATKLSAEILLQEYLSRFGLKGVINRLGVIAGPWQFGKADQGVFTFWLLSHYFKKELNYIGFGGKGKQVRDLLHVEDLFELIDLEINSLDKISGRTYNAGGGRQVSLSLLEATEECSRLTGNRIKTGRVLKERPGDIGIYLTDNRKVSEDLGWKPKRSALKALSDTYRWIRTYEKLLRQSLF